MRRLRERRNDPVDQLAVDNRLAVDIAAVDHDWFRWRFVVRRFVDEWLGRDERRQLIAQPKVKS